MSCKGHIEGQVVCFGDSITHGFETNGYGWVTLISKDHPSVNFVNAGRNGRKTTDKDEFEDILTKYPNADFYLIFLGVNDLKDGNDPLVNNCVDNVGWMVDKIQAENHDAKVVILSPSTINLNTMSQLNVQKKYNSNTKASLVKLEKGYRTLAEQKNVGFVSLLNTVSKNNYLDGLHPNTEGQQQIANAIWKGLNKLY